MKGERYYLLLVTAVAILCVSAVGELAVPHSDEPVLLGRPNPALADLKELYVIVELAGGEPNNDGLAREALEKLVADKLTKEAGITVAEDPLDKVESDSLKKLAKLLKKRDIAARNLEWRWADVPELRVDIDMLKLGVSQQYVFHIQVTLARPVVLPVQRGVRVKTDVWELWPVMEAVSVEDMPGKVTETVLRQVETFIGCYLVASANYAEPADVNHAGMAAKGQVERAKEPAPAKYSYVASKNSRVFHRAGCSSAKRISPENLVGYNNREGAIQAGKRPCKRCEP
ncbi:MAG: Ada metal-binding domain-containing protein [Planctomycetota bacterium]|jgi:hypothetical protein